jgi:hypothetical protein
MPTFKVTLNSIRCNSTEDITGADDIYILAAWARGEQAIPPNRPKFDANSTRAGTWEMNNGDVMAQETPLLSGNFQQGDVLP